MVANTVGDPLDPQDANREALPAVIDPATGELLTDDTQSHHAYVRPVPRGDAWFQIGPGLTGLWDEVVHVDPAAMLAGADASEGVSVVLPRDSIDDTDLCWFPEERSGFLVRQFINMPSLARWTDAP